MTYIHEAEDSKLEESINNLYVMITKNKFEKVL